jgi:hypothetical protein
MPLIPYGDAGMAEFNTDIFTGVELFAGSAPMPWTSDEIVAAATIAGAALPAFSVVGFLAGELVMAKTSATAVIPIGITTAPVNQLAVNRTVAIFRAGAFNMDALNWHADYNTDLLKRNAFLAGFAGAAFNIKKFPYAGIY